MQLPTTLRKATLALGALLAPALISAQEPAKPNILFIFTDDLGATDLACYGSDLHRTPNLDRLAAEGVRFTQARTAAHVCSPTRASIITGKTPARLHLTDWLKGHPKPFAKLKIPDWTTGLPHSEGPTSLGTTIRNAGYATAWLGKWHLGGGAQPFGFDASGQSWAENKKNAPDDPKGVFTLNKDAQDFITKSQEQGKPFFVTISHYSPHGPVRFHPDLAKEYEGIIAKKHPANHKRADYAAMIEALDTSVGQMVSWLEEKGLRDNTLIVFTSDNGGEPSNTSNAPLRAGKGTLYEGGVRVPFIANWPGHIKPGLTNDTRLSSIDVLPTFAAITGAPQPQGTLDGQDLSAAVLANETLERGALHWHYPHYHAAPPCGAILKGDWKLIEWFEDGRTELFNLAEDPTESNDVAAEHKEKAEELLADLRAWREESGAQMPEVNPDYDPARANEGPAKAKKESAPKEKAPAKPKADKAKAAKAKEKGNTSAEKKNQPKQNADDKKASSD